jgi:hypothetical protein
VLYVFVLAVFYHLRPASSSTLSSIVSQEDVQHTCSFPNCPIILRRRYQQAAKVAWRGARNEVVGHRFEAREMQIGVYKLLSVGGGHCASSHCCCVPGGTPYGV